MTDTEAVCARQLPPKREAGFFRDGKPLPAHQVYQGLQVLGGLRLWLVGEYALSVGRGHGNAHAAVNLETEHLAAQLPGHLLGQVENFSGKGEAGIEFVEQNAQDL